MGKKLSFSVSVILYSQLLACSGNVSNCCSEAVDTLQLRHARNLTIVEFSNHTEVTMRNPWGTTSVLGRYFLSEKQKLKSEQSPTSFVHIPLKNIGVFSSVHLALLHELQTDSAVGGICDLEFCNLPYYKKAVTEGRVANLGNSVQPSLEQIINLNPDAMLSSPFENSGGLGRIDVPHLVRLTIGAAWHRTLFPATILIGANLALICNLLSTLPRKGSIIPISVITPLIGAPVILHVILRQVKS